MVTLNSHSFEWIPWVKKKKNQFLEPPCSIVDVTHVQVFKSACNNMSVSLSLLHRQLCYQQSTKLASCRPTSWFVKWWPGTRMSSPTAITWCTSTTSCTRASLAATRYDQQMAPVILAVVHLLSTRWRTSQTHVMYVNQFGLNTEKQLIVVANTANMFLSSEELLVLSRWTPRLSSSMCGAISDIWDQL